MIFKKSILLDLDFDLQLVLVHVADGAKGDLHCAMFFLLQNV